MVRKKTLLPRSSQETAARLIAAAENEFNSRGFFGTDTNRIARAAGYAPQTFYRHFKDKIEIFLAVYERWWRAESDAVGKVLSRGGAANLPKVADVMIAFHVEWRIFRRSLRHLSAEDDRVGAARVSARRHQIETAKPLIPGPKKSDSEIAAVLLVLERLCDAVAEKEFIAMGFRESDARKAVISALIRFYDS
jgi:AcrR family transcriptional regulator